MCITCVNSIVLRLSTWNTRMECNYHILFCIQKSRQERKRQKHKNQCQKILAQISNPFPQFLKFSTSSLDAICPTSWRISPQFPLVISIVIQRLLRYDLSLFTQLHTYTKKGVKIKFDSLSTSRVNLCFTFIRRWSEICTAAPVVYEIFHLFDLSMTERKSNCNELNFQ